MLYSEKIKKALIIAYKAHDGQLDKGGYPYIFHPYHLAEQMNDENEIITAILHDVCEDTKITFNELEKEGFGEEIIRALRLLTREKGADYFEYIKRLSSNDTAKKVKLADLMHNMDLSRVGSFDENRMEKYKKAYAFLNGDIEKL